MTINDILNSDLSDNQKIEMIKIFQKGGKPTPDQKAGREPLPNGNYLNGDGEEVPGRHFERHPEDRGRQTGAADTLEPTETITVGDKEFDVEIADSEDKRKEGLSKFTKPLKEGEGMLFMFDSPVSDYFTMKDTSIPLDIIFISEDLEVLEVHTVEANDPNPVLCESPYKYVLETAPNSGVQVGDEVDADSDLSDDDKKAINGKMLVLDPNGDVQMELEGGERIFSRISTKKIIRAALKAYQSDNDSDYAKVAKIVFKELDAQDSREPQYTSLPEN